MDIDIDGFTNTYMHGYIVDAHISYFYSVDVNLGCSMS